MARPHSNSQLIISVLLNVWVFPIVSRFSHLVNLGLTCNLGGRNRFSVEFSLFQSHTEQRM